MHNPSIHPSFSLVDTWNLPDYDGVGVLCRHDATGAEIFHVANEDEENFFAFAFATLPEDSTGVAHILEHTVLCGSERYPVKDPFIQLLKGSVNTFLNAMTYPDKTVYPAASPVREDLFNMMRVYSDAVFFPQLKEEFFRQEGHRLIRDEKGALGITGVVYNEMIGNYSNHDSVVGEYCYQSLLPDTIYRHDSGGNPKYIPSLTYEQFKSFHERYYHPANARIVLYGNIPTNEYLTFLNDEVLSRFSRGTQYVVTADQPRWTTPHVSEATYPSDGVEDLSRRTSITMNWLLFPVTEQERLLEVALLSEVLLGHSGSPLTQALIDSGLGQDLSPVLGLEADLREAVFSVGLRGTDPEHRERIEEVILQTMTDLVQHGLPADQVEGALRIVEFRNRELKSGPQGLRVMNRALRGWMYGASPVTGLQFSADVENLRQRLTANPRLLEQLMQALLLDNPHRTTVVVRPDAMQSAREIAQRQEELAAIQTSMSPEELQNVVSAEEALQEIQQTPDNPEDLARIPFLRPEDIPREVNRIAGSREVLDGGIHLYRHEMNTRGIFYLDFAFDLPELTASEESLLNLLGAAFTEVGLPGMSSERLQEELRLRTGGISVFFSNSSVYQAQENALRRLLVIRLKVLDRIHREGLDLLQRILTTVDFSDLRRLRQVVDELTEDMTSALIPSGHYFAGLRSARSLSGLATLEEQINGISQVEALRNMQASGDMGMLGQQLAELSDKLLNPQRLSVNITGETAVLAEIEPVLQECIAAVAQRHHRYSTKNPAQPVVPPIRVWQPASSAGHEYLLTSAGVSFVTMALPGQRFGSPLAPAQDLLAHILHTGGLWEKIRMRGGAYGAFAASRTLKGIVTFASYRDPQTTETLDAFRDAVAEMAHTAPSKQVVDNGRVSMLGRELRPLTTREQGYISFRRQLLNVSDELRQEMRDRLREVTPVDVQHAAIALLEQLPLQRVSILGGAAGLERYKANDPTVTIKPLKV